MLENVLSRILHTKFEEVAHRRARLYDNEVIARANDNQPALNFHAALRAPKNSSLALIAEVKKASPSAGIIRLNFDPIAIATNYEDHGADCLSVLTDETFFQGSDSYLKDIRRTVSIPLLRKDFVVDSYQVYEARMLGADAVLLIVAALSLNQIVEYQEIARELGMAALVEVHDEHEMTIALQANADLIGINNRNLSTFHTDIGTVQRLAPMVPGGTTLVAESGIKTSADAQLVRKYGASAILVGESLMRCENIGSAVDALMSI